MEELIIVMVMHICKFDDKTVDVEKRIACMEQVVNCILNKNPVETCLTRKE